MKKKLLLLTMLTGIMGLGLAQEIPTSVIEINNVRGMVLGTGNAFSNELGNSLTWEVPKDSGLSPLFQYSLWVGGLDINNQLHVAAQRYFQDGRDYWMGPLTLDNASIDAATEREYEHIWNLTRAQIDDFIANHGQPGYVIPEDFLTWPAHGPQGYAANLAPFVDVNGDHQYNPEDGDYPSIVGDQCLFFIFNDSYAAHTESEGQRLGMEVHAMVYAYDAPDDDFLNNTVFFHYDMINRSTYEYVGTYVGVWNDWDIGYAQDDYAGCDVRLGACYGYNATSYDANYGDNPPVQMCTILAGPYMDPDGIDNPAFSGDCDGFTNYYNVNFGNQIVDDERLGLKRFLVQSNGALSMGDPYNAEQTYLVFQGNWKDGTPVMYGGDGYSNTVGPRCDYMFPNDSDPCNYGTGGVFPNDGFNMDGKYWTEVFSGDNPGDRRGLAVMGPFTYKPGQSQPLDFALTTVWKTDTQSALDRVAAAVNDVKHKFEVENHWAVAEQPMKTENLLKVYPNPSEGTVIVEGTGRLVVVNAVGQQVIALDIDEQTTLNLPAGLYFVRIENEKGSSVSKLLVK